jgi:methionyl-tRNA formyltransferase
MSSALTSDIRVIFMGTPEFAVPSLRALVDAGYHVVAVVTQPDRPVGRSRKAVAPGVKQAAQELGLPVMQPEKLRPPEVVASLRQLRPDLTVVAAYGEILRPNALEIPRYGNINVHASLLPKYRGAAPISAAILAGEPETGVTIMLMDVGMDSGPTLAQRATPISATATTPQLTARLAEIGASLLIETLPRYLSGALKPQPQDDAAATYTRPLQKDDGRIDWQQPAAQIARMVRAYYPWPSAFTTWQGKRLKLLATTLADDAAHREPGLVYRAGQQILVATGAGGLALGQVQLEGRQAMEIKAFIAGQPQLIGSVLGKGEQIEQQ